MIVVKRTGFPGHMLSYLFFYLLSLYLYMVGLRFMKTVKKKQAYLSCGLVLKNNLTHIDVLVYATQITRRDEEMTPFVADVKRNYIFGGICPIAANWSIKVCSLLKLCWELKI